MGCNKSVDITVTPVVTSAMKHPLEIYLAEHNESHKAFSKRVGTSRQTIYRIVKGKNKPSPKLALKIVEATQEAVSMTSLFEAA